MGNELNGAKGDKGARGGNGRRIQGKPGAREQVKAHGPGIARIGESIIPRLISHAGILFPPLRAPRLCLSLACSAASALLLSPGELRRSSREDFSLVASVT